MNEIHLLTMEHRRLRKNLADIQIRLARGDLRRRVQEFSSQYREHERKEDALFSDLMESKEAIKDWWPIKGYHAIHLGSRELLEELQGLLDYGSETLIKHALLNFQSLTLSHFEYEEKWIFPLLKKALRVRAGHPGNPEGLAVAAGEGGYYDPR